MARTDHYGKCKKRGERPGRTPELGYYIIITDTKETEKNYLIGLRDSITSEKIKNKISIKVMKAKTENLVSKCKEEVNKHPQYAEPWIVLDRDEVINFDKIIKEAEQAGIKVGWSNPCIEIWFRLYLDGFDSCINSKQCIEHFENLFEKKVNQEYEKSDFNIYNLLAKHGEEKKAIETARKKHRQYLRDGALEKPSMMCPCTTLYMLIEEIREKVGICDN